MALRELYRAETDSTALVEPGSEAEARLLSLGYADKAQQNAPPRRKRGRPRVER